MIHDNDPPDEAPDMPPNLEPDEPVETGDYPPATERVLGDHEPGFERDE